jgi:hypothetical protein
MEPEAKFRESVCRSVPGDIGRVLSPASCSSRLLVHEAKEAGATIEEASQQEDGFGAAENARP